MDFRVIGGILAALLLAALRSFLCTLLGMLLLSVVLAGCSYYILADRPLWAVIAALVALFECLAVGFILAVKRAPVVALVAGLREHRLGGRAVGLLLERLLGARADQPQGERGGVIARAAERLPLAQAEKRLNEVVDDLLNAPPEGRGLANRLRRRLRDRLLRTVRKVTLAHFRQEDARYGGVDLLRVRAELGERIDDVLIRKLKGGVNLWTGLVLVGLPTQMIALDFVVFALLK